MGNIQLNDFIYLESTQKFNSFDVSAVIKIIFLVPVTMEPSRSVLTVCYHELSDSWLPQYLARYAKVFLVISTIYSTAFVIQRSFLMNWDEI